MKNINDAIRHLRKIGWKVSELKDGNFFTHRADYIPNSTHGVEWSTMTAREVIRLARKDHGRDSKQNTVLKGCIRDEGRRERTFVRDRIAKIGDRESAEEADLNFPRRKFADPWYWT